MRSRVAMCCFCENVRDDTGTQPGEGLWQHFTFYMARYLLRPEEVMFSYTYCPGCLLDYRNSLMPLEEARHRPRMERAWHDGFTNV